MMRIVLTIVATLISSIALFAQSGTYAPAAGEPGSTAIHKDSVVITGWASACVLQLGPQDISVNNSPLAAVGNAQSAIGQADGNVVSLGDGGIATLEFDEPIANKAGFDFAVFENGFEDVSNEGAYFLELAHVEISSDGVNFVRFPSHSLTDPTTQTGPFEGMFPSDINNLAGKYEATYGTPFDLEELKDSSSVDINSISHIRLIDAVGSISSSFATYDAHGLIINDPWPTDFASSGFDLDGVAVLDITLNYETVNRLEFQMYPNPVHDVLYISGLQGNSKVSILNLQGMLIMEQEVTNQLNLEHLPKGAYLISITQQGKQHIERFIKQ